MAPSNRSTCVSGTAKATFDAGTGGEKGQRRIKGTGAVSGLDFLLFLPIQQGKRGNGE